MIYLVNLGAREQMSYTISGKQTVLFPDLVWSLWQLIGVAVFVPLGVEFVRGGSSQWT